MGQIAQRISQMRGCSLAQIVAEIERMEDSVTDLFGSAIVTHEPIVDYEAEFHQQFWPRYPNKTGKPVALTAFIKARKKDSLHDIIAGLGRYVASKPTDRPWLNPSTFLNQSRYFDEPASTAPQSKTSELRNDLRNRIAERQGREGGGAAGPVRQLALRRPER